MTRWQEDQKRQDSRFALIAATLYNVAAMAAQNKFYSKPGGGMFQPSDFVSGDAEDVEPEATEEGQRLAFMTLFGWPGPKENKSE